jgi:hypothetical protein
MTNLSVIASMRRSLPEVLASLTCNLLTLAVLGWIAYSTLRLLFNGLKLFIKWLYRKIQGFDSNKKPAYPLLQATKTSKLETPIHVARNGAVIFENIDDASMRRLIRNNMVIPTDYFFRQGMKEWQQVNRYS